MSASPGVLMNATTTVQAHNQRAATVWSSGGAAYDRISRGISDAIEHAVVRLDPQPGQRILDLATGTGWASRSVARRGAEVVGADIADHLLDAARELAQREHLAIDYALADAEALPFEDGEFDAVISTFGVMFAGQPEAAAAEITRVLRPGGRVALSTWLPDSNVFKMFLVMKAYMAAPPQPAPPSPFEWGKQERVSALLGQHFELRFERGTSMYREPDGQHAWETFVNGYGPTKMLAASLDAERRAALQRDFVAFHDTFGDELGITVPRGYLVTVGTRR
jgi:ubiquinone/menaquinone biosynthesis C-methylase UbiE